MDASCLLQLPCDDIIWKQGLWKKTLSLDELANRTLDTTEMQTGFAHVVVMVHILGRSAQYMLQEYNIRSRHPPWDPSSDFAAIESDLLHLESHLEMHKPLQQLLAPHVTASGVVHHQRTGPILFSRALFHLCYCLLNHPFLLRRRIDTSQKLAPKSFLSRAFNLGWQHAQYMIELIYDARSLGCVFQASFSGYCAIIAGSIAALQTYHENFGTHGKAQAILEETIGYLESVGHYWHNVSLMVSHSPSSHTLSQSLRFNVSTCRLTYPLKACALRRIKSDSSAFKDLCSSQPRIAALSLLDENRMWSVVDYSTISNEEVSESTQDQQPDASLWYNSWIDLFSTTEDGREFQL